MFLPWTTRCALTARRKSTYSPRVLPTESIPSVLLPISIYTGFPTNQTVLTAAVFLISTVGGLSDCHTLTRGRKTAVHQHTSRWKKHVILSVQQMIDNCVFASFEAFDDAAGTASELRLEGNSMKFLQAQGAVRGHEQRKRKTLSKFTVLIRPPIDAIHLHKWAVGMQTKTHKKQQQATSASGTQWPASHHHHRRNVVHLKTHVPTIRTSLRDIFGADEHK